MEETRTLKEVAVDVMKELDIYWQYVNKFKAKAQTVCEFANYGGFYIDKGSELDNKIKELESKYGIVIYAVLSNIIEDSEVVSFLYVANEDKQRSASEIAYNQGGWYSVYAYVWNKEFSNFSEFGTIGVKSFGGGLKRVY